MALSAVVGLPGAASLPQPTERERRFAARASARERHLCAGAPVGGLAAPSTPSENTRQRAGEVGDNRHQG